MSLKSPILLIGFNRYDTIQVVFNMIKQAQPEKLYFAVDGARKGKKEEEDVIRVRDIIKQVNWACDVHTLFRENNVGCGKGPSEAISWAFENEDRLIVLEDDCVPSMSFFRFCDEMLEMYKDDERVNIISGRSHQSKSKYFDNQDYIFTHYAHTWGWATWKRVWNKFDLYMKDFPEWIARGGALNVLATKEQGIRSNKAIRKIYDNIEKEVTHSWDSQWSYTRMKTGGLGIVPCKNLIQNIGDFGTHSQGHNKVNDMMAEEMPEVLRHPPFVVTNIGYEILHYKKHILGLRKNLIIRAINKMFRIIKNR